MLESLRITRREATDSSAVISLTGLPAGSSVSIYGPSCVYARTLPATFLAAVKHEEASSRADDASLEVQIPDPCYWTPSLPFLYELTASGRDERGELKEERRTVALRRLVARKSSLYLNGERIVFRGARVDRLRLEDVASVRAAEVAVVLSDPSEEERQLADSHGLPLIVKVDEANADDENLIRLSSHPSTAMILLGRRFWHEADLATLPTGVLLGIKLGSSDEASNISQRILAACKLAAVELPPGERPPAWMADCGLPVIAIRQSAAYADFHAARAACDRLQAELAPAFDLAGYFV